MDVPRLFWLDVSHCCSLVPYSRPGEFGQFFNRSSGVFLGLAALQRGAELPLSSKDRGLHFTRLMRYLESEVLGNSKIDVISYLLLSSSAEPGIGYLSLGHLVGCCKGICSFIYPSSILNFIKEGNVERRY